MGKALTNDVEDELQKLLIVDKLRKKEGWYETREFCSSYIPPISHLSYTLEHSGEVQKVLHDLGRVLNSLDGLYPAI